MPRDANGTYTLPAGNPVVTGTTIETAWANPTMDDIKQALTDSLDRYGRGGMQAPFRFIDGTAGAPGMSWASELSTGFYRAAAADMRATVAGVPMMRWTGVGVDVWDTLNSTWLPLTTAAGGNFALLGAENRFTSTTGQISVVGSWQVWKDATPTLGARLAFNTNVGDSIELSFFNGSAWRPRWVAGAVNVQHYATQHLFWDEPGSVQFAALDTTGFTLRNGKQLGFNNADNSFGADISNASPSGQTSLLFRIGGAQCLNLIGAGLDYYDGKWARFFDVGNNKATVAVQNGDSFSLQNSGTTIFFSVGGTNRMNLTATDLTLAAGVDLRLNTETAIRQNPSGPMLGAQMRDVEGWKGPALYHGADSANYRSGNVITSTAEAPASGYTAGTIWIQREA